MITDPKTGFPRLLMGCALVVSAICAVAVGYPELGFLVLVLALIFVLWPVLWPKNTKRNKDL